MIDGMNEVREQAVSSVPAALVTLDELMSSGDQTGPVRVAAAKAVIDFALKLEDKRHVDSDTLSKLDELLGEYQRAFEYKPLS